MVPDKEEGEELLKITICVIIFYFKVRQQLEIQYSSKALAKIKMIFCKTKISGLFWTSVDCSHLFLIVQNKTENYSINVKKEKRQGGTTPAIILQHCSMLYLYRRHSRSD